MSEVNSPTPSDFQRRTLWAAITGLSLVVLAALICGFILGMGYLFVALEAVLLPLIIAGILAYLLHPLVILIQRRIKKRILSILIVLAGAASILAGFAYTIFPPLIEQTGALIENRQAIYTKSIETSKNLLEMPLIQRGVDMLYEKSLSEKAEAAANSTTNTTPVAEPTPELSYPEKLNSILSNHTDLITTKLLQWLSAGSKLLTSITTIIIGVIMVPVFLFYFLLESEHISRNWHDIIPLRHSEFRDEIVGTLQDINNYIISFVRGQMLVSLIDGIILGVALKIMGLPYAITIAAAAAVLGIIPYIGTIITSLPALLIAWFTWQDPSYLIATACIFICVNQFDGWVIQPRIIGKNVGMHDMTIMFSVLFWSIVLGGIVGALLAVPLTASLKVIFARYVWAPVRKDKSGDATEQKSLKEP